MSQVKKNFFYNIFYQILAICIPLFTTPYASRVLGAEGIGLYSYTYSIAYYFMITGILGINNYGNREIAKNKDSKEQVSKKFLEIYSIQLLISTVVLVIYYVYVIYSRNHIMISLIQSLYVISSILDINWFYSGIEEFKITVTRNSIIKIISLFMIFIFVKDSGDTWIYTLILAGSTLISNIYLFLFLKKYVSIRYLKTIKPVDIIKHFKPCIIMFIPVIAMKIYKVMDKTMIGSFSSISEVGFYTNADGIINIPMGIIIALGTVMLPRFSNMIATRKK